MVKPIRPKVRPLSKMLDDPNKEISKTSTYGSFGMLSKLWRVVLKENNVTGYRFSILMDNFLADIKNKFPEGEKERFDNRGNLNKEFSNPKMSWKVFCKCMRFMGFKEFRITLDARHSDGKITTHRVMVDLEQGLKDIPLFDEEMKDPNAPNDPLPDDQEHIPFLDPEDEFDSDNQP